MDQVTQNALAMYDEFRVGHYSYGLKREQFELFLLKFLDKFTKGRKLGDVGCGSGFGLDMYVRHGVPKEDIFGVDLSPKNIEDIKKKGFRASVDNALSLQIEDNAFDFTVSNGLIQHTSDPFLAFKELVRITKPSGFIYLAVYNALNPYYYFVHKMTFSIRYWYWNKDKRILDFIFPIARILMQPFSFLFFREFLDDRTAKTIFMDQVMTPRAYLFLKDDLRRYCTRCDARIEEIRYIKHFLMVAAIIQVNK